MLVTPDVLAHTSARLPDDVDPQETTEWLDAMEAVLKHGGPERAKFLLETLIAATERGGAKMPGGITTPYVNTIPVELQAPFPGDRAVERKIKSIVRWNAMAMVLKANKNTNVGGHISTFASAATLYEIGFNHFFHGKSADHPGDVVFFQGHASPGMYSRAFVEGRLDEIKLTNFRQELQPGGGISSYPHPWLMPDFWQYPTVSMGLGPIMSIYHARYNRYLHDRSLAQTDKARVWAFLGDGECDEPESLGAISLAGREKLDNLTWVINCNLQRLDGPVRGNSKIIQELEGIFRGAGWNVIKVVWGTDWDELLRNDHTGALSRRMMEVVDGEYCNYVGRDMRTADEVKAGKLISEEEDAERRGQYIRDTFFNTPELKALVEHLSNKQVAALKRGGHDPLKVYAAYKTATEHKGQPTVILVKTVKGYGIPGDGGQGKFTTHQLKKLAVQIEAVPDMKPEEKAKRQMLAALRQFRERFELPAISDEELEHIPFYRPSADSPEAKYVRARRAALGGPQPFRNNQFVPCRPPERKGFERLYAATIAGKGQSTTLAWVNLMTQLCRDPNVGQLLVPIVPDEGQTFGMPPMYKAFGMYSSVGQLYTPVDKGSLSEYRESKTGQILQEGINEAGSMASWIAAGTAYSTHGVNTIPFYIYYSMFGFQRIGDLAWAAADARCRGFLMGATAGRTTINGEGLQHEDGHSHLVAMTIPTCRTYDPAFAYELAVIVEEGINAMYVRGEECFYYLTIYNESYDMPAMPNEDVRAGIIKGLYPVKTVRPEGAKLEVQLLGSGVILNEALRAQGILAEKYGVASTVYSATSYQMLRKDAIECERHNRLHPDAPKKTPYVSQVLGNTKGPIVATSDYMRALPETVAPYLNGRLLALGTDGFGRSETRKALRRFFEVDAENVAVAALYSLFQQGQLDPGTVKKAVAELGLNPGAPHPWTV
ncbi:Pyruvate dehydrogenase E1 component [Gemmata obscuriglobus]|uniref:Pyruvate dehydrogenase E1 component n=1 Tax=Gemmata obscuriglobus TaxID=114 RepID=A0A2Z3GYZ3_9BACT|nr:pyruvate dehydrogenase (acetyl-transferring), homodimeric type [Gemmata obscuriglobus]AWM37282.1 pyruvate dehydrogenase (acetyl-transferring), homodimeric type [Gemmata obscuriglobus]QEG29971.1 Pyruvate dehydrogenase E1 component [Gemmata obscuriglobus]VTS09290.1 pyruvate dehydrogenase : Pyruvate dehydrogenase E1 component OS=Pirellula staleyi (strain ATCC 27377 / DSM 6068 / ICPB 4128) GN=Psta_3897 PE=4 SV=1: Transketolase_N: Transketolase_N [Gemmata obscuriglobus UQM 2246]